MNNLHQILEHTLQPDSRLWDEEKQLNKTQLLNLLAKYDETILALLLSQADLKRHFFAKVGESFIFKMQDFHFFLDSHKINNSYTQYANRIGLTDGKRFLKDSSDIVLDFPFKDCVLNGGQSSEEGEEIYFERNKVHSTAQHSTAQHSTAQHSTAQHSTAQHSTAQHSTAQLYTTKTAKRKEIFFNQVLAFDEIDRLFDPKALTNAIRYTKDGKQPISSLKRHPDGTPAENLIIKGNNLIALHSLKTQFKGKVKLIYIDVPFNTGNDSFAYNDKFNRSTWLTFMKNRIEAAKDLLSDNGVIFVHCDYNEDGYLRVLLDEIFTEENFVANIAIRSNSISGNKTQHKEKTILKNKDTILVYKKSVLKINPQYSIKSKWDTHYNAILIDDNGKLKPKRLVEFLVENHILNEKERITENSWLNKKFREFCIKNAQKIYRLVNSIPVELKKESLKNKDEVVSINNNGEVMYALNGKRLSTLNRTLLNINGKIELVQLLGDLWGDIDFQNTQNEGGISFPTGKKPEALLHRIIDMTTKEGDIVLDYHLGSGTTAAVAHKMNRQYIGIEQMDYIEDLAVARLNKVIEGEQGGISKAVNWQGDGDFIYCELAQWNESAKNQILACKNFTELHRLFEEICEKYFLKYTVSIAEFAQIMQEADFQTLDLNEQQKMMLEMLDLNQMYISASEMNDETFSEAISDSDKTFTAEFYGENK